MGQDWAELDRRYVEYEALHRGVPFATWVWRGQLMRVQAGRPHPTIGANLASGLAWDEAGERTAEIYRRILDLSPDARVVDVGCGTLRIGVQLVRFLDRGCYFGLEPIEDFVEMGRRLAGPLLEEKDARVEAPTEDAVAAAADFGADVVLSTAVAFHIHPDGLADYAATLTRLAHRPGARVVFDAKVADRPLRYAAAQWASPLERFQELLVPLELVALHHPRAYDLAPECTAAYLEFRRGGTPSQSRDGLT